MLSRGERLQEAHEIVELGSCETFRGRQQDIALQVGGNGGKQPLTLSRSLGHLLKLPDMLRHRITRVVVAVTGALKSRLSDDGPESERLDVPLVRCLALFALLRVLLVKLQLRIGLL